MAKRKRKQTVPDLPRANSAATPLGPWSVVTWSAVEPQPQTVAELQPPPRRRKGPAPGTVNRYEMSDRELYPELERLAKKCGSVTAAARQLADEEKIAGTGTSTNESRARRLASRYFRDHLAR